MSGTRQSPVGSNITKRPVLASYEEYLDAQKAVDTLSDNGFPVKNVAIVGVDVRIVESVIGRMSWGKAATSGLFSGAWFGGLIGLFIGLFSTTDGSVLPLLGLGVLYGAAAGIVFGVASYAFTGGKRDFVSRQQLQATRYDVLCEQSVLGQARTVLGLAPTWPPALPVQDAAPARTDEPA